MKIGMVTANQEEYSVRLLYFLISKTQKPDYVILVRQGLPARIRKNLRLRAIISFIQERFINKKGKNAPQLRDHLAHFLETQIIKVPDISLIQACKREGVTCIMVSELHSEKTLKFLRQAGTDLLINAGGGIFKSGIIDTINIGILNAHMGYLPDYRGMNVLEWSLFYNKPVGVTLHMIDRGIDTGDILSFREIPIEKGDTIDDLRNKSAIANFIQFSEVIAGFSNRDIVGRRQLPEEGRQYFVMHPRLKSYVAGKLSEYHIVKAQNNDK